MRGSGETPSDRAREIGLDQFRDRAWVSLKLSLIAEEAVGEKQDVETAKLLNDLVELGTGISARAIERPRDRLRRAARHKIGGDRFQPRCVPADQDEAGPARRPEAGRRFGDGRSGAKNHDPLSLAVHSATLRQKSELRAVSLTTCSHLGKDRRKSSLVIRPSLAG